MIYMDVKPPGFEASLKISLDEMGVTGSSDSINIMVLLGRNTPKEPLPPVPIFDKPSVYRVEKGGEILITTPPLLEIANNNLGDPEVLIQFLRFCKDNFSASRYMLLFWDHGTGSGIEAGTSEVTQIVSQVFRMMDPAEGSIVNVQAAFMDTLRSTAVRQDRIVSNLFYLAPVKATVDKQVEDEEDFLYVTEVRDAIKVVFPLPEMIDIVAFDACWLQMFENGYTLRDCCRYMVASENLISADGMGYMGFFQQLAARPLADTATVGAMLINASYIKEEEYEKFTMSCLDLSKTESIAGIIDELAELLISRLHVDDFLSMVHNARFLCLSFFDEEDPSDYDLQVVDLIYFTRQLVAQIKYNTKDAEIPANLQAFYEDIKAVCKKLAMACTMEYILSRQIGSAMAEQKDSDKRWGAHGFTIFFPEDKHKLADYAEGFYSASGTVAAMPFADEHRWKAFLLDYLARI